MLKIRLFIVFMLVVLQLHAGNLKKAYTSLEQKDYKKAHELLTGLINKDSSNTCAYLLTSILYSSPGFEQYNLDKAYDYTLLALKHYDNFSKRKLMKFTDLHPTDEIFEDGFSKTTIYIYKEMLDRLCYEEAKKKDTYEAYEKYIQRHQGAPQLELALQERDKLAYSIAVKENTWQSMDNFIKKYPEANDVSEAKVKYDRLLFEDKTKENTWQAYQKFCKEFPDNPYKDEAHLKYQHLFYKDFTSSGSWQVYKQFQEQYPDNIYAGIAKTEYEKAFFEEFTSSKTAMAYQDYIEQHPDSRFVTEARLQVQRLNYESAVASGDHNSYLEYYLANPESPHASEAKAKYDLLLYETITKDKTYHSYKNFFTSYPYSPYADQARRNYEKELFNATVGTAADIKGFQKFLKLCENKNSPFYAYAERYIYEISTRERSMKSYKNFVKANPNNTYISAANYRLKELPFELAREEKLLASTTKNAEKSGEMALPRTLGHKKGHNFRLRIAKEVKENCEISEHITKAENLQEDRSFANGSGETFSVIRFAANDCNEGNLWLITKTGELRGCYKIRDGSIYLEFENGNINKCAYNIDGSISVLNLSREKGNNIYIPFDHAPLPQLTSMK